MLPHIASWRRRRRSTLLALICVILTCYAFVYNVTTDYSNKVDEIPSLVEQKVIRPPRRQLTRTTTTSTTTTTTTTPKIVYVQVPVYKTKNISWFHQKMTNTEELPLTSYSTTTKRILYWTDDFSGGSRYYGIGGLGPDTFRKAGCPVWQCEAYDYMSNISHIAVETFDAIVIHDPTWYDRNKRPARRSPHQRYVWWNQEAPGYHSYVQEWSEVGGFFNWTMTYRWDSDIVHPYGWFTPVNDDGANELEKKTPVNHAEGKTKMAAWFVSNCDTRNGRNEYIRRLQKYVDVDVYGRCGTLNCSSKRDEDCRHMMERTYKFAIAFENSLCYDYVTEKLFRQMTYDVVPIVLDVHGNYARFAPPKSYINALDFPSIRHLADYLKLLDSNDTLYNEYFWWKGRYSIHKSEPDFQRGLCRLCSMLHGPLEPHTAYDDLATWWHDEGQCKILDFINDENDSWTARLFDPSEM